MRRSSNMRKLIGTMFCLAFLFWFCRSAMADGVPKTAGVNHKKPRVVMIRADWCPYCQQIEPTLKQLQSEYSDQLDFVVLDVTNQKTTAQASQIAKLQGLGRFFAQNKEQTSTVAIFQGPKLVFRTSSLHDRATYLQEFERALNK